MRAKGLPDSPARDHESEGAFRPRALTRRTSIADSSRAYGRVSGKATSIFLRRRTRFLSLMPFLACWRPTIKHMPVRTWQYASRFATSPLLRCANKRACALSRTNSGTPEGMRRFVGRGRRILKSSFHSDLLAKLSGGADTLEKSAQVLRSPHANSRSVSWFCPPLRRRDAARFDHSI